LRVLLVKMSSLGDVVHALPAVTDAADAGITFDWVVEEAFADIPAAHPAVATVIPIAWRRWRRSLGRSAAEMRDFRRALRARRYDAILDSQGLIKSAVVAALATGPRQGFSRSAARESWAALAYGRTHAIATGQHAVDRQRQLFAAALGYETGDEFASGLESTRARGKQVLLLHGTTWPSKHWPLSMWQALARDIQHDGFDPVVTWGSDEERARAMSIADASGATVLERQPLADLGEVLAQAAAVIGVDSGLCHYSAALGTPTLGLYGPTDGNLTGARGQCAAHVQATTPCSPCLDKQCRRYRGDALMWQGEAMQPPCFATLTPELVWARARQLMGTC